VSGGGVTLALVATAAYNTGFILEKRALGRLPSIELRRPRQLVWTLFTAPAWLAGFLCMAVGLGCQVVVLTVLPVSVVQPLQAGGVAVLLLLAWLLLGERAGRRDWWRLAAVAGSVVLLGLSVDGRTTAGTRPAGSIEMVVVLGLSASIGVVLFANARRSGGRHRRAGTGTYAGLTAGWLYGMAGLGLKALSSQVAHRPAAELVGVLIRSPYLYVVVVASVAGMGFLQTALQRYRASVVVPTSNVAGSCYVLVTGTWLFHESLPATHLALGLRIAGYAVALVALAIAPSVPSTSEEHQPWHSTTGSSTSSPARSTRGRYCISSRTRRSTTPASAASTTSSQTSR
jgi:drug/metabolite transporter (DMT)-like permease